MHSIIIDYSEAPKCFVASSSIEGNGLFAKDGFNEGDIIADYSHTLSRYKRIPYELLPDHTRKRCWFIGPSPEFCAIAPPNSAFMYANHSRMPTALWIPKDYKLIALNGIKAGQEITYDYRLEIGPQTLKQNPPVWA